MALAAIVAGCVRQPLPDPDPAVDTTPAQPARVDAFLEAHYRSVPMLSGQDGLRRYVKIAINGRRGLLLVDTGAQHAVLFEDAIAKFGITDTDKRGAVYTGVAGTVRSGWATFDSFTIGDKIAVQPGDFRIVRQSAGTEIDGLLGLDILTHLRAVVDLRSNRLWFLDPATRLPEHLSSVADKAAMKSVGLRRLFGSDFVNVRLDGYTYRCVVDTGAPTWLVAEEAADDLRLPRARMQKSIGGIGSGKVDGYVAATNGRAVVDNKLTLPRSLVAVADHGDEYPISNYGGLFGCSILTDNGAQIDIGNGRIYFPHQALRTRFAVPAGVE